MIVRHPVTNCTTPTDVHKIIFSLPYPSPGCGSGGFKNQATVIRGSASGVPIECPPAPVIACVIPLHNSNFGIVNAVRLNSPQPCDIGDNRRAASCKRTTPARLLREVRTRANEQRHPDKEASEEQRPELVLFDVDHCYTPVLIRL
jgi:hypothetical protein